MECSNTKCLKPDNDRMVTCWLCLKYYHLKCSGSNLRARDADALADAQKFLNWTCASCRNVGIEFYNLFKNSKAEFENINKEFISLQARLVKFGELFTNYNNLDKFMNALQNTSPKQKKKNVRSVSSQCSLTNTPTSNKVGQAAHVNSELISEPLPNVSNMDPVTKHLDCVTQKSISTPVAPVKNHCLDTDSFVNVINDNNIQGNNISVVPELISPKTPVNNNHNIAKPLRVIRPNKTIFISRLASDTTVDDVQSYVNLKCGTNLFTSVYKFSYSEPRMIASFKITVADELFNKVMAPEFWPTGTYIREFIAKPRQRNSVRLPTSATNVSKN